MEIKINGKEVQIHNEGFVYDEVSSEKLKELNGELYKEVKKQVEYYKANHERLEKEKAEKEKAEKLKEQETIQSEFRVLISKELKAINDNKYELSWFNITGRSYDEPRGVLIELNDVSVSLKYNGKAYTDNAGAWHAHNTDRIWEASMDYKTRRYTNLTRALKKIVEFIDEKIVRNEANAKEENEEIIAENAMAKFAEKNGFKYEKTWRSNSYISRRRGSRGTYSHTMEKDNVRASLRYNAEEEKVEITSYTISKENITVEELKKI